MNNSAPDDRSIAATILCLNSGSSSLKFALFQVSGDGEKRLASGAVEDFGPNGRLWLRNANGMALCDRQGNLPGAQQSIAAIFEALDGSKLPQPGAAGHRIVHGGPFYSAPQKITVELRQQLRTLVPLAPLHLPAQIDLIEAIARHYPHLPQVACFDTAFHSAMPEIARRLPLTRRLWDEGVRRYGFHGLSYEFIVDSLGHEAEGRVIVAHLGNGASIAAIRGGKSVDTSMGLTPTGGFMMSTRSGDLDPGVLLYLLQNGYTREQLERLLTHESGLLGVSGSSSDMKTLLESRGHDPAADLAIRMFCYGVRKFIGAYAAALCGLDILVFTGGIGEHAPQVREEICRGLEFLGIELDLRENAENASLISNANARCSVRVVATDEDLMIARHTARVAFGPGLKSS